MFCVDVDESPTPIGDDIILAIVVSTVSIGIIGVLGCTCAYCRSRLKTRVGIQRRNTPDAIIIDPDDSISTVPTATETAVDATIAMPPVSGAEMEALPTAIAGPVSEAEMQALPTAIQGPVSGAQMEALPTAIEGPVSEAEMEEFLTDIGGAQMDAFPTAIEGSVSDAQMEELLTDVEGPPITY